MAACGGIADLTLDAAQESPDFEIVAIQDVSPEALRNVGDRHGIARRHLVFAELLTDDIDFVVINSPNHCHLPQVVAAAAAGKHCLVQKPMAPTYPDARAMVEAAREHGVRLGVTMFELGKPIHHEVKAMVAGGFLGDPVMVQATAAHDLYLETPPPEGNWRRDAAQVGGGAFIQLAVHQINLACWVLDSRVASITVTGTRGRTVFEDETTLATLRLDSDVLGHFAASYATDLWGVTFLGTRGRIHVSGEHVVLKGKEPYAGEILRYEEPGRELAIPVASLTPAIEAREAGVEIHGAFARWIRGQGEFPSPGERGLEDMAVVEAAYRSLSENRTVEIVKP
jgi:predicted dehydrogenase